MANAIARWRGIAAAVVACACAGALTFATACSSEETEAETGKVIRETITAGRDAGIAFGKEADMDQQRTCAPELPSSFDLRDYGLVTPVKSQNPWGTCWAFATLAAAETSALSATGTTYKQTGLDFSEKHLSWFPFTTIVESEDPAQTGEGIRFFEEDSENASFHMGLGYASMIESLLSTEGGPADEADFPYRGIEGITEWEFFVEHPDEAKQSMVEMIEEREGTSFAEYIATYYPWSSYEEALETEYQAFCDYYYYEDSYSTEDDWSIPATDEDGYANRSRTGAYLLSDANRLPQLCERDEDGAWTGLSTKGMEAAKREIFAGRGVAVCLAADQSLPGERGEAVYMDTETWAHYTFENAQIDHEVCIVGWDDDYSLWNFPDAHRPSGNGAWIAKNSWGSETDWFEDEDGRPVNNGAWGALDENGLHTGYFYISYYDKSLTDPSSFAFSAQSREGLSIEQYDYLPGIIGTYGLTSDRVISMANVFAANEDGAVTAAAITTPSADAHVCFDVYLMGEDAADPMDGTLAARQWQRFGNAGFHRLDFADSVPVKKGQRFAIVCTMLDTSEDGPARFHICAAMDDGEDAARAYAEQYEEADQFYAQAVVNEGESYLFENGLWQDWSGYLAKRDNTDGRVVDNFPIKAYVQRANGEAPDAAGPTGRANGDVPNVTE